jgi:hypothetical protein
MFGMKKRSFVDERMKEKEVDRVLKEHRSVIEKNRSGENFV